MAADGQALYVRYIVHQREGITSTQSVDNVGENSDNYVTVRFFLVYGDPNALSTTPAFILKYVHYFGADRGA